MTRNVSQEMLVKFPCITGIESCCEAARDLQISVASPRLVMVIITLRLGADVGNCLSAALSTELVDRRRLARGRRC